MKKHLFLLLVFVVVNMAFAQVPKTLNFQGVLTDASDLPLQGTYTFTFNIYDVPTGGSTLWTEIHSLTTDINGLYNAVLGASSGTAVPINIAFDMPYYLEIDVDGTTLSSRVVLTTPSYTLNDNLEDLADGSLSGSLVGSGIAGANIDDNSITSAKISGTIAVANGGTGASTLTSGNVLIGAGTGAITTLSRSEIDTRTSFPPSAVSDALLEPTIDRTNLNASNNITAGNYITALGGIHVGGTSDPGTDNLVVDGNVTTGGSYTYSSARTRYMTIGAVEFRYTGRDASVIADYTGDHPYIARTQGGTAGQTAFLTAPVHFPHGAIVTKVEAFLWDFSSTYNVILTLVRGSFGASGTLDMAAVTTSTSGGAVTLTDFSISSATVNNFAYYYYLECETKESNINLGIYQTRITYTVISAD